MSNLFEQVSAKIRDSSFVIWVQFLAMAAFMIGLVHFFEDTASSRMGLAQLETAFGMKPAIYPIAYATMSLAPQVGQVVFMYMWLVNRRKNWWALVVAALFFLVDFIADVQARSGGTLFPVGGGAEAEPIVLLVTSLITLLYFTIGSELFITAGVGLSLELFNDSLQQLIVIYIRYRQIIQDARTQLQRVNRTS